MQDKDTCLKCPVRGACCYMSCMIEGYNIILDHQPCEFLNVKTGLCTVYEKRDEVPHCKVGDDVFECGGLPEGCLLLNRKKEKNMKVHVKKIFDKLSPEGKMFYTLMDNNPRAWELYKGEEIKW